MNEEYIVKVGYSRIDLNELLMLCDAVEIEHPLDLIEFLDQVKGVSSSIFFTDMSDTDISSFVDINPEAVEFIETYSPILTEFAEPRKLIALMKHLGDNQVSDYTDIGNYQIKYGREEYLVLTDTEADEVALSRTKDLLNDIGLDGINEHARDQILRDFVDEDAFADEMESSNDSYARDIETESAGDDTYVNRLHQEMVERGVLDEPEWPEEDDYEDEEVYETAKEDYSEVLNDEVRDHIDEFVESLNSDYDNSIEWYQQNFGGEALQKALIDGGHVDMDAVAEWFIDQDGRGHSISHYDGYEHEVKILDVNYYIYREN